MSVCRKFAFWPVFFLLLFLAACQTAQVKKSKTESVQLYQAGQYDQAIAKARDDLTKIEAELGPDDPEVARHQNILSLLYYSKGDYPQAESLQKKALATREKKLGPDHLDTATSLNNLALIYDAKGDYSQAEPLYKRALAIREKKLPDNHPDIASSLNNLAGLYYTLGDYARALPLYQRAVEIWEKSLGRDNPDLAASLGNLGGLYYSLGRYDQAEPLYRRALAIREKSLGPDHPDTAVSQNNLALLLTETGRQAEAAPLYEKSLPVLEKTLGPDHPHVAAGLGNLAALYYSRGEYAKALPLYRKSLALMEKALGPDHPDVALAMENLASLYASQGQYQEAHQLFMKAQAIDAKLIDQVLGFTSEEKKMDFLATKQSSMEGALSLVARHLSADAAARRDALDVWLQRKGIILEAQKRFQEALVYSDDPEAVRTFEALSRVRGELSRLTFSAPGEFSDGSLRDKIKKLEEEKQQLEAKLSRLSQSFALQQTKSRADSSKVARALPSGSVLVELARIDMYDFKARGADRWRPAHYLAFTLSSGGSVQLADLGEARTIDQAVAKLKRAVAKPKGSGVEAAAKNVYDLVIAPLRSQLGGAKTVFVSPDGNLSLIPFEILMGPNGRYLIEDYSLIYLSAGRDLLGFGQSGGRGGKVLLMGDPAYDLSAGDKTAALGRIGVTGRSLGGGRARDMGGLRFSPLPGTYQEVEAIRNLFGPAQVEMYTGPEALEEVLYQKRSPQILHLATHGFFLTDLQLKSLIGAGSDPSKKSEGINPLLRSGLALAGANQALSGGSGSDGILTAEKVLSLRLRGTDLVVLSACQTGLGEVKAGEGVYGLRRAFTQAGARGLVMSMWSVPDKETMELMTRFYENLKAGGSRAQALRQAVLEQKKVVQERYGQASPLFWGAFVFLGEP